MLTETLRVVGVAAGALIEHKDVDRCMVEVERRRCGWSAPWQSSRSSRGRNRRSMMSANLQPKTNGQVRAIFGLAKQRGLDEDELRALVEEVTRGGAVGRTESPPSRRAGRRRDRQARR